MRIFLILRGSPASGKTSWIKQNNLLPYTLCQETLSLQIANPSFQKDGRLGLPVGLKPSLAALIKNQLLERFQKGETTLIDSLASNRDILQWATLARKYGYKVLVLNFTASLETCLKHNESRKNDLSYLLPSQLSHLYHIIETSKEELRKYLRFEPAEHFSLSKEFSLPLRNLEHYQEIISVGDIHGCITHLQKLLPESIEKEKFYIFVGDYLDRGYDNAGVMRWIWENCFEKDRLKENVVLLAGNHERYLWAWLNDEPVHHDEFTGRTRPELLKAGWHPAQPKFKIFLHSLSSCFCYEFFGKKVFLSHAGVPAPLEEIWKVSALDFEKGWGHHGTDIDKIFSQNVREPNFYQIHGHRNPLNAPILAQEKSFNLAGQAEFGGELRAICHQKSGFVPFSATIEMENHPHHYALHPLPQEITELFDGNASSEKDAVFFTPLKDRRNLQIIPQKGWQDIISVRLKKNSDKEKNPPTKAQGLFLHQKSGKILARSYDKCPHIDGKQKPEKIARRFSYPVSVRSKEDGFLGLTGSDGAGHLLLASRNYLTGPFAEAFAEKIGATLGQKIFTLNETFGVSCLFEVIDPLNFPNIIEYAQPQLILQDVIYRETAFRKVPDKALPKIAAFLEVPFAEQKALLKNEAEFLEFLAHAALEEHAGYIFEDQHHFILTYTTPYYQAWNLLNSVLHSLLEGRKKHFPADLLRLYRRYPNYFTIEKQALLRDFFENLSCFEKEELKRGLLFLKKHYFET